jgi:hypothetical protein
MISHRAARMLAVVAVNAFVLAGGGASQTKTTPADDSIVVGDWRGDSICVVRESACHDEDSLYHVARLAEKPGWFSMKLDKIVDGKPVTMGRQECSFDSGKQILLCEFARGVMRFTLQGNKMEGSMTLTDGTLWRKISLKKSTSSSIAPRAASFQPTPVSSFFRAGNKGVARRLEVRHDEEDAE